jgi:D-Tyr-tRNAtyr deacylase
VFDQTPPPSAPPLEKRSKSVWLRELWWELLVISNFTLYGRNKKAWSVDFTHAAKADVALPIYDYLINELKNKW